MNGKNTPVSKTLADLLESRGTLTQDQILTLLKPVMTAVTQLHKQNRVHGHISPETIILHDNSRLFFCCPLPKSYQRLLQASASKNGLNMTASLAADAAALPDDAPYRAPESYMGQRFMAPAADVYSLCAVIYRALTGKTPLSLYDVMYKPAAQSPDKVLEAYELPQSGAPFSEDFKAVLEKGLSPLPKDRYADAAALERALAAPPKIVRPNSVKTAQPERPKINHIPAMPKPVGLAAQASQAASSNVQALPKSVPDGIAFSRPVASRSAASQPPVSRSTVSQPAALPKPFTIAHPKGLLPADFLNRLILQAQKQYSFLKRENIEAITFQKVINTSASPKFDVSAEGNHSILAWVRETSGYHKYHIFVAADGGVATGSSCKKMFADCTALKTISFNGCFDTSRATTMYEMFSHSNQLTDLDLSCFNTGNVTDMWGMFWRCGAKSVNLSGFNTSRVTNMNFMFYGLPAKQLDLTSFDTSNVTTMHAMFAGCTSLESLDISSFHTDKVTYMSSMFADCRNLNPDVKHMISNLNMTHVVNSYGMVTNTPFEKELLTMEIRLPKNRKLDVGLDGQLKIFSLCKNFYKKYTSHFYGSSYPISRELKQTLQLPADANVYLSYDPAADRKGKSGFAITDAGIYCKNLSVYKVYYTSYPEMKAAKAITKDYNNKFFADDHLLAEGFGLSLQELINLEQLFKDIKNIL
ncbi:MAG TPA: BspA family leucine-rich repeat surface protein [Candidatus Scybalocola faecipullorum]|nr:BspA family leucine-rich repeat surface protein [Candidatus Scybalocola faecipullorum]